VLKGRWGPFNAPFSPHLLAQPYILASLLTPPHPTHPPTPSHPPPHPGSYISMYQLIAEEFSREDLLYRGRLRLGLVGALLMGAASMCVLAIWT
jgi:hypothetical protein